MNIQKKIEVHLDKKKNTRQIDAVQYDTGIQLVLWFMDFIAPEGTTATLYAQKPSGKFVYQETDIEVSEGSATILLENQVLTECGKVAYQVRLKNGDDLITTFTGTINVERSLADSGAEESKTVISAFKELTEEQIAEIRAATQTQIALVEAESVKQQNAIEEKGANTLATIPEDYTETYNMAAEALRTKAPVIVQKATGSDILVQDSTEMPFQNFTGKGGSSQNSYSGYQLFDASKLITKSAGGAAVTNNGDGSFTISGSGKLTENNIVSWDLSKEMMSKILVTGNQIRLDCGQITHPYMIVGFYKADGSAISSLTNISASSSGILISDEIVANTDFIRVYIYGLSGYTIKPGTIKPMLYIDGDGTWEPFVGGIPSPNADYPQDVESVGDGGWFDGELVQGYYPNGVYTSISHYVCGKNKIPCRENDIILISYEEALLQTAVYYYDIDGNFLSVKYVNSVASSQFTVPTNACYFHFALNQLNITPTTAKKIVVTINGTYAVKIKSVGRNFFGGLEFANALVTSGATINATYSTNGIIGLQSSSATGNAIFYDNFKENTQYTIFFKGINSITNKEDVTNMAIVYTDGSSKSISFNTDKSLSLYTSTAGKTIKHIKGSYNTGIAKFEYDYFGIMEGVCTLEDFEPYKEHTEWIPLSEPLRGIGEVTDTIKATDGLYRGHRKFKEIVFDGSEAWIATGKGFYVDIGNTETGSSMFYKALCDSFTYTNDWFNVASGVMDNSFTYYRNAQWTLRRLAFYSSKFTTLDEWKANLQSNPITVLYELAEEEIEELDQSPFYRLKTFEGVTHISASDDMEMEIEYATDTKRYIDNKFAELSAALLSN